MGEVAEGGGGFYREQVRGRAVGSLFFTGFGALLGVMGLVQTGVATPVRLGLAVVAAGALAVVGVLVARRAAGLPSAHWTAEDAARAKRMFRAVNIIFWVSVVTAVAILWMLAMPEYIAAAVGMLVGLHLFPLAGSFRYAGHRVTGVLLVAWCLACLAVIARAQVSGVAALGSAVILLGSAVAVLGRNVVVLRR